MTPTRVIEIVVEGEPIGQPRQDGMVFWPKGAKKPTVRMYTPQVREKLGTNPVTGKAIYGPDKLEPWKRRIELACYGKVAAPIRAPLRIRIDAFFPRCEYHAKKKFPKGHVFEGPIPTTSFPHTAKPDKDNVEKAVLDAMKTAGVYTDDCMVFSGPTNKWYCAVGYDPGVRIVIEVMPTVLVSQPAQLTLQETKP